jgi:RHS repeat-associated protein
VHSLYAADGTTQTGSVLRVFAYDGFKRPVGTAHTLDGGPTWSETQTYDAFGRVFQRLDASGADRGVQYVYNANGYLQQTLESAKSGGTNTAYSTISARNAYGSVTQETLGNGYVTTRSFEAERGLALAIRTADALNLSDTQDLTLVWDLVGNLLSRRDQGGARDTTESHTYDALNRLRITSLDGTQTDATTYDAFGNLKSKTGIGTYSYLSTRPHAVSATSSGSKTWSYDANGNMDGGDGRTITYTTHDKPELITKGTTSAAFRYGPGREYYKRVDTVAGVTTTTWFVGATEIVDKSDGTRDIRRSVDGVVEQVLHFNAGGTLTGTDTRYLLRDHLGSITGFMNGTAIDQEQAFDAWGRRENVGWASYMTVGGSTWNAIMALTERGFTGHQHVDRLDFIHMNGRTYDPRLGRFMQADIVVQAPHDTQSYNRYSYLSNNPLNGTDPSGYFSLKELVGVAVAAVGTYICMGNMQCGYPGWALVGAASGGSQAAANGGDFSQVVQGAAWGAFSAAAFYGVGNYFQGVSAAPGTAGTYEFGGNLLTPGQIAGQITAHGVVGGTISVMQGGNFGHGFLSAGLTKGVTGSGLTELGSGTAALIGETAIAAVVGGTASVVAGGKFANGATTAAFGYLFNQIATEANAHSRLSRMEIFIRESLPEGVANHMADALAANKAQVLAWIKQNLGVKISVELAGGIGAGGAFGYYTAFDFLGRAAAYVFGSFGGYMGAGGGVFVGLQAFRGSAWEQAGWSGRVGGHFLMLKGEAEFARNSGGYSRSSKFSFGPGFGGGGYGFVTYQHQLSGNY